MPEQVRRYCQLAGAVAYCVSTRTACFMLEHRGCTAQSSPDLWSL